MQGWPLSLRLPGFRPPGEPLLQLQQQQQHFALTRGRARGSPGWRGRLRWLSSQVSNGAGPQDERITSLLVFSFLQSCSPSSFRRELEALGHQLSMCTALDDELQTDGSQWSHPLGGAADTGGVSEVSSGATLSDFSFCESRGGHLGHRQAARTDGDTMGRSIHPGLIHGLAAQFTNGSLSEEREEAGQRGSVSSMQDRRRGFATTLGQLLQACPADVDQEKTLLVLTMLLAKEVASHTPALLQDVFRTTVNFINQNLLTYVRNLVQNVRASNTSS
ncbi:BH3-interacting domain death agonist [Camelus dromedarius]|uniref:BH3-interacting domain death agonist n=1 Tax=Camelus dromedarius TaxID=9838 RepID=A0A5N4C5Y6_CAMDR|nr:BH3-interacting domain death agonist [Camelus dromedarius]